MVKWPEVILSITLLILIPLVSLGASKIEVKKPWVMEVPPVSTVTAVYMVIENSGDEDDRLIGVSTGAADSAEIHTTAVDERSIVSMKKSASLDIPSGGVVELKPGGSHIMLIGLEKPLEKGGQVELDLKFEKFGAVKVRAFVMGMDSGELHGH
ncbi:MAG TPA: copper chaperone PCu(A)C [Thermodesulfobacteriota bacterium]|nr:copper chaperone PCu(A)C [Thermodesulfobacteriota bacterium]